MTEDSGSNRRDGPGEPWGVRGIRVADRIQYLVAHCRGKSVLHVGCASAGLTERKLRGDLPHASLGRVASALSGVDIDAHGVEVLKSAGYEAFCCDARNMAECLAGRQLEVVVMGNMLDLVQDPGAAIRAAGDPLHPTGELIVTIANACKVGDAGLR